MSHWRRHIIILGLLLVSFAFVEAVWKKEGVLKDGEPLLLKLAPVDPRSLMQGDYMILNYAIPQELQAVMRGQNQGELVYTKDEDNVAEFVRLYDAQIALTEGERKLHYRTNGRWRVSLGANSFFFEEGQAEKFSEAKYGELRMTGDGSSVLVGLRDDKFQLLGLSSGLKTRQDLSK